MKCEFLGIVLEVREKLERIGSLSGVHGSLDEKDVGSSGIFRVGQHAGGEVCKVVMTPHCVIAWG